MIKPVSELRSRPIEIDLTGPDGNAFVLLAYARQIAEQLDKDADVITADMKSGNYEHLLEVFEREFGEYVVLYREDEE